MAAFPVVLVAALLLASVWWDSAFDTRYWAPLTIVALALLLALVAGGGIEVPRRGPLAVALAAVWGLAAIALLSAAWSQSPGEAWTGGAHALFYAAAFTLAAAVPGRLWVRLLAIALPAAVAAVAVVALFAVLLDGAAAFAAGRLNVPAGYRNGTAALFAFAVWPLLRVAARRGVGAGPRAAAFATAPLLLGLAFMTQSRGVLLGLVAGAGVALAIGPDRLRVACLALLAAAAVAVVSPALLDPFHAFDSGAGVVADADAHSAGRALLIVTLASFGGGLLAFLLDDGLRVGPRARRWLRVAAATGLGALAVAACVMTIARVGDPISYAGDKVDEFTDLEAATSGDGIRLGTVGGQRYDLYRVAWEQFTANPLAGAGEGSYQTAYYLDRRTDRNLDNPHSLPLRMLSQTGLIGFVLLVAWLVGAAVAIGRRARRVGEAERLWIGGLAAAAATVIVQSFVDWLWLLPGLFGLAVLALGLAAGGEAEGLGGGGGGGGRKVGRLVAALGLSAAIVSVSLLFLSDLYVRKARVEAATSPAKSLDAARTARRLDPVSTTPLYLEAAALETLGRRGEAREALEEALDLEPRNFVNLALLGDLEVRARREDRARAYYRASFELNPLDIGLEQLSEFGVRSDR